MYNLILSFFLLLSLFVMGYGMYLLLAKNINTDKYIPQYVKDHYKNVGIGCLVIGSVTAVTWSVLLYKLNFMQKILVPYQSPRNFGFRFY